MESARNPVWNFQTNQVLFEHSSDDKFWHRIGCEFRVKLILHSASNLFEWEIGTDFFHCETVSLLWRRFCAILRQTAEIQISPIEMGLIRIKTGAKFVATFKKMHRKTGFFLGAVSGPFFHTEICMNIPLGETGRVQFTQPIHTVIDSLLYTQTDTGKAESCWSLHVGGVSRTHCLS